MEPLSWNSRMLTNATKLRYHTSMTDAAIVDVLKNKGLRNTSVRRACIEFFSSSTGPIDAQLLISKLQVNKTTIYRELATLLSLDIILEIDFGDGKKRYELASRSHHHHLICTKCKSVSEYEVETDLSFEEKRIKKNHAFIVSKHTLEFFGICKSCSRI